MSEFLSGSALVLLTLLAYCAGATIAGKRRMVTPELTDVIVVVAFWCAALATRGTLDEPLHVTVWVLIGLLAGAGGATLRRNRYPERDPDPVPDNASALGRSWAAWKSLGFQLGNYQSRVLLALFYFVVVFPFGMVVRLFKDPLQLKPHQTSGTWGTREKSDADMDSVRSQF